MIIKGRGARLDEVVPDAPTHCPSCQHRVGTAFSAIYTGTPEDKTLVGWMCRRCGVEHMTGPPVPEVSPRRRFWAR